MQKMMEQLSQLQSQTEMMGKATAGLGGKLKNVTKKAGLQDSDDEDDNQMLDDDEDDDGKFMIDTTKKSGKSKRRV